MDPLNVPTEIVDLAEARRRLPRVKVHVERIMEVTQAMRGLHAELTALGRKGDSAARKRIRAELSELEESFRGALKAMNDLGAYLKDPDAGLIDFYTWQGDDLAFLCWRHGEETIEYWHGLHEGFPGRKPVAEG